MRNLTTILVAAAAVAVAGTTAVAVAVALDDDPIALETRQERADTSAAPATDDQSTEVVEPTTPALVDEDLLSRDEAGRYAVDEIGDGATVHRVQRDDDDGRPEYEVHLSTADGQGYEVHLDATDGTVLEVERDTVDTGSRPVAEATLDREEAGRIALDEVGGEEVVQADLEEEGSHAEWELDVRRADGTWVEVTVDAIDGTVLEVDVDD